MQSECLAQSAKLATYVGLFLKEALSAKPDLLMQYLAHLLQRVGGSEFDAQICLAHLQQQL